MRFSVTTSLGVVNRDDGNYDIDCLVAITFTGLCTIWCEEHDYERD